MNTKSIILAFIFCQTNCWPPRAVAIDPITNPVANFRLKAQELGETYTKWEADINGDGHNEIFIINKLDYDNDVTKGSVPAWCVYISAPGGNTYTESIGIGYAENELALGGKETGAGELPAIDPNKCFVGEVGEIGKRGIVTQQVDRRDDGTATAYIYVYTIDGNRLLRIKIAEYDPENPGEGGNPIYNKYLKEDKRTAITITPVPPP